MLVRVLGIFGGGRVDGNQVLLTSGNFLSASTRPYVMPVSMPPTHESRTRVAVASGTTTISGSVGFDLDEVSIGLMSTSGFLRRRHQFDVEIFDGTNAYVLEDCFYSSLSMAGNPGGLVSVNLSLHSANMWKTTSWRPNFIRGRLPIAYWETGNDGVQSWTLNINQDVRPVFSNTDSMLPTYLSVGAWDASLEVVGFISTQHKEIKIGTKTFTIIGQLSQEGYQFETGAVGTASYTFESGSVLNDGLNSDRPIFTIT